MARYSLEDTTLTNIANAIRNKTNKTNPIEVADMADEIASIEIGSGGGTDLPSLTNPASASDILASKEAIDDSGNKITGTIETFDGSYTCSGESTGGEDVTDETAAYTEKLATLENAITLLESELEGKASGGSQVKTWTGTVGVSRYLGSAQITEIKYTDGNLNLKTLSNGLDFSNGDEVTITIAQNTIIASVAANYSNAAHIPTSDNFYIEL